LEPQSASARRRLAGFLAARGGQSQWQEALRLLEGTGGVGDIADPDRRAEAILLIGRRGKENLAKARQILEQLIAGQKRVEPLDRLRLAQTHELSGNIDAANEQYFAVASRTDVAAAHLAAYVDFLLRQEDMWKKSPLWMDKLEKLAPNDIAMVGLRARWLDLEGRKPEIGPLVEKAAGALKQKIGDDKQRQAQLCLAIGAVYRSVKDYDSEQRWCRQLKDLLPERYEPLAGALAHQGHVDEAIGLCLEAAKSGPSAGPALVLAMVLTSGRPTKQQFDQGEVIFSKAFEADKDNVSLLNAVASVRIAQNRMDDAVPLLKRVLKLQPRNWLALNNLASILGEQPGKLDEALPYVDQAIGIVGEWPLLLDTKAMVLFYGSRPKEAAELLEAAVLAPGADPRFFFHVAAAYDRLGEKDKAAKAFHRALAGNLDAQLLTEKDKKLLAELSARFK
jgi:tetratricopeptide (TPR) repeat protein